MEHRTRVLWYRKSTVLSYVMNEILETIIENEFVALYWTVSWRFYYNCVCPRKPVGVLLLQLSDFAVALPSVYANWRGIYFAELEPCSIRGEINGWTVCSMNYEDRITERNPRRKHIFCDTALRVFFRLFLSLFINVT